jgi:hypothetical protein
MGSPSATVGNCRELLDIDVDEFARVFALITLRTRLGGSGSVTSIEAAQPSSSQDRLNC